MFVLQYDSRVTIRNASKPRDVCFDTVGGGGSQPPAPAPFKESHRTIGVQRISRQASLPLSDSPHDVPHDLAGWSGGEFGDGPLRSWADDQPSAWATWAHGLALPKSSE